MDSFKLTLNWRVQLLDSGLVEWVVVWKSQVDVRAEFEQEVELAESVLVGKFFAGRRRWSGQGVLEASSWVQFHYLVDCCFGWGSSQVVGYGNSWKGLSFGCFASWGLGSGFGWASFWHWYCLWLGRLANWQRSWDFEMEYLPNWRHLYFVYFQKNWVAEKCCFENWCWGFWQNWRMECLFDLIGGKRGSLLLISWRFVGGWFGNTDWLLWA